MQRVLVLFTLVACSQFANAAWFWSDLSEHLIDTNKCFNNELELINYSGKLMNKRSGRIPFVITIISPDKVELYSRVNGAYITMNVTKSNDFYILSYINGTNFVKCRE